MKQILILVLIVLALFVSGCSDEPDDKASLEGETPETVDTQEKDIIQGKDGADTCW